MMMARNSQPDGPRLDPETLSALRDALQRCLATGGEMEAVRPALRRVAAEARERHMLAEQLLVSLKDVWHELPQVRAATDPEEQQRVLQRLVTLCIREYYASQ